MVVGRPQHTEEQLAELIAQLPPVPEAWVAAARAVAGGEPTVVTPVEEGKANPAEPARKG